MLFCFACISFINKRATRWMRTVIWKKYCFTRKIDFWFASGSYFFILVTNVIRWLYSRQENIQARFNNNHWSQTRLTDVAAFLETRQLNRGHVSACDRFLGNLWTMQLSSKLGHLRTPFSSQNLQFQRNSQKSSRVSLQNKLFKWKPN